MLITALLLSTGAAQAQESARETAQEPAHEVAEAPAATGPAALLDSSYRPSPSISARLQHDFLSRIRWNVGAPLRDALVAAFAERKPTEIWQDLVRADGLTTNNVVDAVTAYWVLNWVTANGAYSARIDNAPIRRQLQRAMASDQGFLTLNDQQRQTLAENYVLDFLLEHAALNEAVASKNGAALARLATASVTRFRQKMGIDLLSVQPGPDGFAPRPR
ncbi:MAG: hypothetical protein ABS75_04975 [Pelagibacterium sp. SCN 63-23]|nr:MAG: hypothetical protein ABS75_04975 [Pelagibacterium sp. SCN 63-23]